jgi:GT2 family glycosyltransferase
VSRVELSKVTAVIKTFERPKCLDRLVRSLQRYYPQMPIMVGDDSFNPHPRRDVDYTKLPSDMGLSAGRNALLARVRTPYFLLLDDDLEIRRTTTLEHLLAPVADDSLDIAAGDYLRCKRKFGLFTRRRPQPYHGTFLLEKNRLQLVAGARSQANGFEWCDLVHNFFVARTSRIRDLGGWNAELMLDEHEEFFLRAQRFGLRVGFCRDVVAWHWSVRNKAYNSYRFRDFKPLAVAKMGLTEMVDYNGNIYSAMQQAKAA